MRHGAAAVVVGVGSPRASGPRVYAAPGPDRASRASGAPHAVGDATRFEQIEQTVWARHRPVVCAGVAPVAATPPPTVVVAVDGCVIGTQGRPTRRRRLTKTTPLSPLPPVPDGTFREVKTAVLLLPTDRVALPDRAALVRRVVVTGLTDADGLFRQVNAALRERGWLSPQTVIVLVGWRFGFPVCTMNQLGLPRPLKVLSFFVAR